MVGVYLEASYSQLPPLCSLCCSAGQHEVSVYTCMLVVLYTKCCVLTNLTCSSYSVLSVVTATILFVSVWNLNLWERRIGCVHHAFLVPSVAGGETWRW